VLPERWLGRSGLAWESLRLNGMGRLNPRNEKVLGSLNGELRCC
jgi:hypothetical protein